MKLLIIAILACLIIWVAIAQWAFGDSRQTCETVQSVDTCMWELR